MKVFISQGVVYDFCLDKDERGALKVCDLETDLLDMDAKKPIGKRVQLRVRNIVGEGQLDSEPEEAGFDSANRMIVTIGMRTYEDILTLPKDINARWSYGDFYFHRTEDMPGI